MLIRMLLAAGFIVMSANLAGADDSPSFFPKGTKSFAAYGSYLKSFDGQEAKMGAGTVGVGYYIFDNFSLNLEAAGYYDNQPVRNAVITAADLSIRHHLFHSGRFSFFGEGVVGITYADHRAPASGTYYNYMVEPGIGATFQLHDNVNLMAGVRYFHLSNARLEGPNRNPSINATQVYIGLLFKL